MFKIMISIAILFTLYLSYTDIQEKLNPIGVEICN